MREGGGKCGRSEPVKTQTGIYRFRAGGATHDERRLLTRKASHPQGDSWGIRRPDIIQPVSVFVVRYTAGPGCFPTWNREAGRPRFVLPRTKNGPLRNRRPGDMLVNMAIPPEFLPIVQITVPLLGGMFLASWSQNRRLDDIMARIDKVEARLGAIETVLRQFEQRITRLEERTPPLVRQQR